MQFIWTGISATECNEAPTSQLSLTMTGAYTLALHSECAILMEQKEHLSNHVPIATKMAYLLVWPVWFASKGRSRKVVGLHILRYTAAGSHQTFCTVHPP